MIPGSFDVETAKEVLGDAAVRELSALGRQAAEAGQEGPVQDLRSETYWGTMTEALKQVVADDAFSRRKARLERMK